MFVESTKLMHSKKIIPAIIPISKRHLDTTLRTFADFAEEVQVDIVDGFFAGPPSWPYNQDCSPETSLFNTMFDTVPVELDLMIKNPEETMDMWVTTGAKKIVVHVESTNKLTDILEYSATRPFHLGLSFNNDTDLALLDTLDRTLVDYVQLMGIKEIGAQGQPFDRRVLERIALIREKYPQLPISIDGSVNLDTIDDFARSGATRFVSGSAILKANDPEDAYSELVLRVNKERI